MADENLQEVVIGDTGSPLLLKLKELDGVTPVNLTNHDVRVFLRGRTTNDRPESTPLQIAGCATTRGQKTVTRASGSFTVDGVVPGMLLEMTAFPRGTQVVSVSTLSLATDTPAVASQTGAPARFWFGLLCTITSAAAGEAQYVGVGSKCDIATQPSEIYDVRVRIKNTLTDLVEWFDRQALRVVRP